MEEPLPPPENYPVNNTGLHGSDLSTFAYNNGSLSVEQKKELFEVTRNSLEVLSSMLKTDTEPKPTKVILLLLAGKQDLTVCYVVCRPCCISSYFYSTLFLILYGMIA